MIRLRPGALAVGDAAAPGSAQGAEGLPEGVECLIFVRVRRSECMLRGLDCGKWGLGR